MGTRFRSTRRWIALAMIAGLSVTVAASAANATPTDDLLDQAGQLQRELLTNGANIETLSEQYNGATMRRDFALGQINGGDASLATLRGKRTELGAELRRHMVAWYQGSGASPASSSRRL